MNDPVKRKMDELPERFNGEDLAGSQLIVGRPSEESEEDEDEERED